MVGTEGGPLERLEVLDHGFVELLDVMGSDEAIEQAARVSYTGGDPNEHRTVEQRRHLIRYLMRQSHSTPFEMAELKFRVALPIVVERQWVRHRTASTNEYSGRYAEMPDLFYVPELDRIRSQSRSNKQGSSDEVLDRAVELRDDFRFEQEADRTEYERRLSLGVAKEIARLNLPLSQYTVKVWKVNLHNLLHFLRLRLDEHAQWEVRQYANAVAHIVKGRFPITWEAFEDYRLRAVTFSWTEMLVLEELVGEAATGSSPAIARCTGWDELSSREQREFMSKIGLGGDE